MNTPEKNPDLLIQLMRDWSLKLNPQSATLEDLLYNVVGDYMANLMSQGNIPQQSLDQLEQDLKEEVLEIYKKMSYGSLNFREFITSKQKKG